MAVPSRGGRHAGDHARGRLDRERAIVFSTSYATGGRPPRQQVQSDAPCLRLRGAVPCVGNRRWQLGRVTGVTLIMGVRWPACTAVPAP